MIYQVVNKSTGALICQAPVAASFWQRFMGLMFRSSLAQGRGLIFYRAPAIHTFFMRFPIDLVFLGPEMKVIKVYSALRPWRLASCPGSELTLELEAGRCTARLKPGDILELVDERKTRN
jgi:uncharacterized membrane protein (UPF0127 family)